MGDDTLFGKPSTGFPFNFSRSEFAGELRHIPTVDLGAEVEFWQRLAVELAAEPDGSRVYIERQLDVMVAELEHRQHHWKNNPNDPLRPAIDGVTPALRARIDSIKRVWPIGRFCREILGCELVQDGSSRLKAHCPLPLHPDSNPSFTVYEDTDSAWCFGCHRGGDVLTLAKYHGNFERVTDALAWLEQQGGVA